MVYMSIIQVLSECPQQLGTTGTRHKRENSSELYVRVVLHRERLSEKAGKSPSLEMATNKEHNTLSNPI